MIKDILNIVWRCLLFAIVTTGIIGFFNMINYENKIDNLEKQVENQTMLIEILKRSCE